MLNAWHLPVAPFIHRQGEKLLITLWLAGDALPEKVMLRYERDNEETPFEMKRLTARRIRRSARGRRAFRSATASRAAATALSCYGAIASSGSARWG